MSVGNILAIDASADACSVALSIDGKRHQLSSDLPRTHAQTLLPMIDQLLAETQTSLSSLNSIAVVHGPSSFPGIRISIRVAQGLSYSTGIPLTCLSSLQAMASAHFSVQENALIVPALDARMGEVYWASYSVIGGQITEVEAARASSVADFSAELKQLVTSHTVIAAGSAFLLEDIVRPEGAQIDTSCQPDANKLLDALTYFPTASYDAANLQPLYVRNEVAWEKRRRVRQAPNTQN